MSVLSVVVMFLVLSFVFTALLAKLWKWEGEMRSEYEQMFPGRCYTCRRYLQSGVVTPPEHNCDDPLNPRNQPSSG